MDRWVWLLLAVLLAGCPALAMRADCNGDGRVDVADLAILSEEWLMSKKVIKFQAENDRITTAASSAFDYGLGDLSICFWAKITDEGDSISLRYNGPYEANTGFAVSLSGRYISGEFGDLDNGDIGLEAPDPIVVGQWVHVVFVINRDGTSYLYINGQSVHSTEQTSAANVSHGLTLGLICNPYADNITIDDLRVYKAALTAAEIVAIYNGGKGTVYAEAQTPTSGEASFVLDFDTDFDGDGKIYDSIGNLAATKTGTVVLEDGGVPFTAGVVGIIGADGIIVDEPLIGDGLPLIGEPSIISN